MYIYWVPVRSQAPCGALGIQWYTRQYHPLFLQDLHFLPTLSFCLPTYTPKNTTSFLPVFPCQTYLTNYVCLMPRFLFKPFQCGFLPHHFTTLANIIPTVLIPLTIPGTGLIARKQRKPEHRPKPPSLIPPSPTYIASNLTVSQYTLSLPIYSASKSTTHFTMLSLHTLK